MNRRGFLTAILAAPLVALGSFAGNHTVTEAELVAFLKATKMGPYKTGRMAGPDEFAKFKGPVGIWTNLDPDSPWTYIEFGDGRIIRNEKWHGKNPLFHVVTPPAKGTLLAGDL